MAPKPAQILLVGAGHAHLHIARHANRLRQAGADVVLADPGDFWYSGLATGVLGGSYACNQDRVVAKDIIEAAGGRFLRARLTRLDRSAHTAHFSDGTALSYHAISFNIGSQVDASAIPGADRAVTVKPVSNLCDLRMDLERRAEDALPRRVVVIGGGATGCEVALNLQGLARRRGWPLQIAIVSGGDRLLRDFPPGAARWMERKLATLGIEVSKETRVVRMEEHALTLDSGERVPADLAILATGLRPPDLVHQLGLRASDEGLVVNAHLQSVDDPHVFGVGDCIDFESRALPKLGVFGVRQAPVLLHNLLASMQGMPMRSYQPQRRYLTILNLGDGTALARRGGWWARGRMMMRLKTCLDFRFLARYRL